MKLKKQPYLFKEGDRVSFGGMKGTVSAVKNSDYTSSAVTVYWDESNGLGYFSHDGRTSSAQTRPVLKLVKKKKPQSMECWIHKNAFEKPDEWYVYSKKYDTECVRVRITRLKE